LPEPEKAVKSGRRTMWPSRSGETVLVRIESKELIIKITHEE
jgi:hypothetical protein